MPAQYKLWKPITEDMPRNHFLGGDVNHEIRKKIAEKLELSERAADSFTTSPIVAQNLGPDVITTFVDVFPFFDCIQKVPANGLSHTWQQQTDFSTSPEPGLIGESGTVTDDNNSYARMTTNVAVFAHGRGVTLKAQFAGQAGGGVSNDLMGRETSGGMKRIARDVQKVSLRYQESDSASTTATAPNGKYNALGFNGLRYTLANMAPPENSAQVDIIATPTLKLLNAVRKVNSAVWDKGGQTDLIICNSSFAEQMFEEQEDKVRYTDRSIEITPGNIVRQIATNQGLLPVMQIQGDGLGTWVDGSSHVWTDAFILSTDSDSIEYAYLGSPEPGLIRVPIGVDNSLKEKVIPFAMYGLAVKAPIYVARVSLRLS